MTALLAWMANFGGLTTEMNSLNAKFNDINEAKTLLDRKLDKSILGAYMQDKMVKLLNSDAFCKAASSPSCQKGKNTSLFKSSDLNSIFPNNSSSSSSSTTAPVDGKPAAKQ